MQKGNGYIDSKSSFVCIAISELNTIDTKHLAVFEVRFGWKFVCSGRRKKKRQQKGSWAKKQLRKAKQMKWWSYDYQFNELRLSEVLLKLR